MAAFTFRAVGGFDPNSRICVTARTAADAFAQAERIARMFRGAHSVERLDDRPLAEMHARALEWDRMGAFAPSGRFIPNLSIPEDEGIRCPHCGASATGFCTCDRHARVALNYPHGVGCYCVECCQ